ncbi:hypothetical protein [Paenibacillus sinopodophylli]|nr:hypothetical protein [Paenibacillus sinopodophylli]
MEKPYQWLIEELQQMIEFQDKHGIDNSALIPLLEKAKEKQNNALSI